MRFKREAARFCVGNETVSVFQESEFGTVMLKISSDFDHGNIHCVDASDPTKIDLEIKPDGQAVFFQWFYFSVEGGANQALTMNILNAQKASYAAGWKGYQAVASYDQETWFRLETSYDGKTLTFKHAPEHDRVYYAYFAAYPTTRYRSVIDKLKSSPLLAHAVIGQTLDGQDIDYFRAGSGERVYWVIARQHPGETMASWWMEGFLNRLIDADDTTVAALLKKATIHIIPCMNLDGSRRGHLRTNAAGIDLNRAWRNTTKDKSPEVFLVREEMRKTGVDFFLDVHGDEAIPNNFLDGAEGIPAWSERHSALFDRYSTLLLEASPDFQTEVGYPTPAPGKANLDIATNYVAQTWDCLAMTLEMPFKDANVNPAPKFGWSPDRCRQLGRDNLTVMAQMVEALR
ncbi:MAG: M14-type cytosolic carboxypeptidase [Pseudomonadota bacterium]